VTLRCAARAAHLALCLALPCFAQNDAANESLRTKAAAIAGADRALAFLVSTQHPDGSWGSKSTDSLFDDGFAAETYYCYQMGAHSLAVLALRRAPETQDRRAALEKSVRWLSTAVMPLRGSNWDNDAVWAWLYGTVAMTEIARDPRFANDDWRGPVAKRGMEFVRWLEKNQVPDGGFGYYDDPIYTQRPKWATSFSTSAVLPALAVAMQLGWAQDPETAARAARYIQKCRLPNGAYEYDLNPIPRVRGGEEINNVRGSLGRIQACNWALAQFGDASITTDRIRDGVKLFFEHHKFLAVARMRPVPHEAYYANAGYFFYFGHFYCSQTIELLPSEEREPFREQLREKLLLTQRKDGSFCDFQSTSYMTTSSTAFSALALLAGIEAQKPSQAAERAR
jgi:Prenyltransferase and squalene oxidase repeat